MPKEIPILMSTPMVLATIEGIKTKTRRLRGLKKINESPNDWHLNPAKWHGEDDVDYAMFTNDKLDETFMAKCQFGKSGDIFWVRETWENCCGAINFKAGKYGLLGEKWNPSIFLKKENSRIWLLIKKVVLERLHDITEEDAIMEGGKWTDNGPVDWAKKIGLTMDQAIPIAGWERGWSHSGETESDKCLLTARSSFGNLWEKINGKESWDANPWVWIIEYKVLSTTGKPIALQPLTGAIVTEVQ